SLWPAVLRVRSAASFSVYPQRLWRNLGACCGDANNEIRPSQTPLPILRGSYGSQPDPLTIVQSAADALASTARARSRPAATGGKTPISRPGQAVGSSPSVPQSQRGRRQRAEQSQTTFPEA